MDNGGPKKPVMEEESGLTLNETAVSLEESAAHDEINSSIAKQVKSDNVVEDCHSLEKPEISERTMNIAIGVPTRGEDLKKAYDYKLEPVEVDIDNCLKPPSDVDSSWEPKKL